MWSILLVLIAAMLAANVKMKTEYDIVDKHDLHWNYHKVLDQHFRYLRIEGGNQTNIAFEQSPNCSLRVLNDWYRGHDKLFDAFVHNDTLVINFTYQSNDFGEKWWMKYMTLVRIFSPELRVVSGNNTNLEMFKLKQKSLRVSMAGKSKFEVESFIPAFDSLDIKAKDSAELVFEMSPEYKPATAIGQPGKKMVLPMGRDQPIPDPGQVLASTESMSIQSLKAELLGYTLLDVGHAQVQHIQLNVADSAGLILSGGALRRYCMPAN